MRRGDIYTAATGGGYGGKPRPVLVLQGNDFCGFPRIIVALFATPRSELVWPRLLIEPSPLNGLDQVSELQVDMLMTVPVRKFGKRLGCLEDEYFHRADATILTFLGFNGRP